MSDVLRFITQDDVQVEELPWGPHEWISREGLTQAEHLLLVRVTMPPGKAHKFHRHPHMEEIIYVVSGHAEQWVHKTAQCLGPGDAAHIPMDVVHGTYNAGDENLVFLAILSPAKSTGPALIDVSNDEPWVNLKTCQLQSQKGVWDDAYHSKRQSRVSGKGVRDQTQRGHGRTNRSRAQRDLGSP